MNARRLRDSEFADTRVVVVDDDPGVTRIIASMLELDGYKVEQFHSGVGLAERLADDPPGLLLLDIKLPELSGVEVLEQLRERLGNGVPVVMLTGESENVELAVDTFKHGASDYLIKPVPMDKLLSSVRSSLRIHRLQRESESINEELRRKNQQLASSQQQVEQVSEQLRRTNFELSEAVRQLEAVFNSVSDGMLSLDAELQVSQLNRAAERICGLPRSQALGQRLAAVLRGRLFNAEGIDRLEQSGGEEEVEVVAHDGCKRHVLARLDQYEIPGGETGRVLVLRDISELRQLREELKGRYRFGNIVGRSQVMLHVYELVEQIAPTNTNVLIEGESGTGKELIAHAIHYNSERANGPFVKVHCSALAETLLESELFGHVRGAFTGAVADRQGRFEAADGGTIFLDEVADMSPLIQLKLLRVIQEREFERVGDSRTRKVDVRIVAATNRELRRLLHDGSFREDLYYRLKVFPIGLPPLRQRRDDIPLLVNHFLGKLSREAGKSVVEGSSEAMARLLEYPWPGNVRELENAVEHAVVKARGARIELRDLPPEVQSGDDASRPTGSWAPPAPTSLGPEAERERILRVLEQCGWNKTLAARRLGIGRTTLWRRLRQLQQQPQGH